VSQDFLFTDFSAGQLSTKLRSRFDLEIYRKGLQKCDNFIPTIPCGVTYRPGIRRVGEPSAKANIIPWIISYDIVYLLEFTQTGIRFWRENADRGVSISYSSSISAADLASLRFAQSPKRLYVVTGTRVWAPMVLTYTGVDAFTWAAVPIMGNTGKVPFQSSGNYPACIAIHEGRLYFASSANEPQKIWASRPGIFFYEPWGDEDDVDVGEFRTAVDATKLAIFKCTTAGTTGTTEPTWPSSGTVADGTAVWTYEAAYWVDFSEYDEIVSTVQETRESARAFAGNVTAGSNVISNIPLKTLKKMHIGDRVWGTSLPVRASLAFASVYQSSSGYDRSTSVGSGAAGSSYITHVSSYVLSLLHLGEPIAGDNIPLTTINDIDLSGNKIGIGSTIGATSSDLNFQVGTINAYITAINLAAKTATLAFYAVLGSVTPVALSLGALVTATGVYFASGWHDPNTAEMEDVTTKRKVVEDSNAFSFLISSDQCDEVLWFSSGKNLVVGTASGERIIPAGTTALTVQCPKHTSYGSAKIPPISMSESCLFLESSAKSVREYIYSQEADGYYSPSLSMIAEGIFSSAVIKTDYQSSPIPIAWFLLASGILVGCVYSKATGMTAWFTLQTAGAIESIAVLPVSGVDTLYLSVLRGSVRTLEYLLPLESAGEHLDASFSGTVAAGAVSGLTWLASKSVQIYYLGTVSTVTVSAGGVATMPAEIPDGAIVVIGFDYTGTLTTMPTIPVKGNSPKAQGTKTVYGIKARVENSYTFKAGRSTDAASLEQAQITGPASEDVPIPVQGDWESDGSVTIVQDQPFDLTILAMTAKIDGGE
jgi:hypothetical protein